MKQHTIFTRSLLAAAVLGAYTQSFAADEVASAELETVSVVGSMNKLNSVPFRQAKSAVTISAETLSEEGVEKMDEIGRYQAGFTNQPFGSDTNTNWFHIRGTEASQAVDGTLSPGYGFFTPRVERYGVETVEITKGADSMTFGAANAGGLINYISKRPHKEQVGKGEVNASVGNNGQYGIGADYTGAISADQNLRYRLVGSFRAADGEWDGTDNKTVYLAPSLSWDISDKTHLTLLSSYQRDKGTPSSNFVPMTGSLVAVDGQTVGRHTNLGDPGLDNETNKQYSLGYEFSHDFDNGITFSSNYRYNKADNKHMGVYVWSGVSNNEATRDLVYNDGSNKTHSIDNRLTWRWKNENIDNTLVGGVDYRHQKVNGLYQLLSWPTIVSPGTVNIFNPTYGVTADTAAIPRNDLKATQLGFYLQDSVRLFNRVGITAGIRHDRAKSEEYTNNQSVKKNHTSYSGSVMYYAPYGISPYFAYSESFRLPTGLSSNQTLYDPQTTEQYEVGVKYIPSWLDGTISAAAFKANDKGALISGANGVGSTVSGDSSKRKGVEIQAQAQITDNLSGQFAYTYQSRTDKGTDNIDYRNTLYAKHSASLRGVYSFDQGALNGLSLGAGVRYVGTSTVDGQYADAAYRGMKVPSSTVFDLFARYDFARNWTAQVNVDNVGDRKYIAACDASYCYYGQGRSILGSVSYKF
ncbi:TonB-dependent siderophore receptor [Uruburuella testudinis]|uniref:TonB-dependent siderophore receptor n=1 Tax=Uruburuella testudinis TaxID=1282863 RepID=A0ABY4DPI5_9NEIS|nr:TonB-dependent siderophore receptor [Uruburuella testudinis]UOO80965.1 TonB-dependent siderophore receptor [Uruburuella testudinis]